MLQGRTDDTVGTYPPGMEERNMRMVQFIGSASVGALAAMLSMPAGAQVATSPPPGTPGDQSTSTAPVGSTATGAVDAARDEQTAPAGTSTANPDNGTAIGDIVVTAQRREESLSRVGITVAAVGSQELLQRGINNPQDLVKLVPGFQATTSYGGNPVYTLRGIGFNTRNASSTSPVGIYQDEAAIAYPYMSLGILYDLERVEVLKGPQGTLYGRNATGGLVNYVSGKPTDTLQGGLNFEAGTYGTLNVGGFVSGPVNDAVRVRVAFNSLNRGQGYQRSITRDETLGKQYLKAMRTIVDIGDGGPFSATLTGELWKRDGDTPAPQAIFDISAASTVTAPFELAAARASIQPNPTSNRNVDWYSAGRQSQSGVGIFYPGPLTDSLFWMASAKLGLEFSPTVRLQSLTSYQDLNQRDVSDAGGIQTNTLSIDARNRIKSFAQELRLIGESDRFNWSIGGYYADDTIDTTEFAYNNENTVIRRFRVISQALPSTFTPAQRAVSFGNFRDVARTDTQVYAGFVNADYKLSDLIKVTLGGRYTQDKTQFSGCTYDTNGGSLAFINTVYRLFGVTQQLNANECYTLTNAAPGSQTFLRTPTQQSIDQKNFAFRGVVDITPSDTTLFYASISRGFKSGGFPVLAASNVAQFSPIEQEQLTAYEVGAKLGLFDRSLQLNLAGFYYDYKNKQVYGRVADMIFVSLSRIRNIPKSREWGIESDLTWRVTPELTARVSGTYLNSRVGTFQDFTEFGQAADITGQRFPYTPAFSGAGTLAYDGPVGNDVHFIADANISYQTDTQADLAGTPQFNIKAYELVDGSVGLRATDNSWRLSVYATNLFDKYYWIGVASGTDTVFRFPGMPRQIGVRTAFRF